MTSRREIALLEKVAHILLEIAAHERADFARRSEAAAKSGKPWGRTPRPVDLKKLEELRGAGKTLREIAAETGVPRAVVHRRLRKSVKI